MQDLSIPSIKGRVLVAGVGNALRGDDAFGVEVAGRLLSGEALPNRVKVIETGIGGISLVQELMERYDAVIIVDAEPFSESVGRLSFRELRVPEISELPDQERAGLLADTHYANPTRALVLARALGVLPKRVYLLGCQADPDSDCGPGLSPAAAAAVERAVGWLRKRLLESSPEDFL